MATLPLTSPTKRGAGQALGLLVACVLLLLSGCDGGEDPFFGCVDGLLDCPCTADGACNDPDARCFEQVCRILPCVPGTPGCACLANETCGRDAEGSRHPCVDGICLEAVCPTGEVGCVCGVGETCASGLLCRGPDSSRRCLPPACTPGRLGCICDVDGRCAARSQGEPVACVGNICAEVDCEPGARGCVCDEGFSCASGLQCGRDGLCGDRTCTPGTIDCACAQGTLCYGTDLRCESGTCRAPGCPPGAEGCGCRQDGTCEVGGAGYGLSCQAGRCERVPCTAGEIGCSCAEDTCRSNGATCEDGRCRPRACEAGTMDCFCADDGTCDAGLHCENGQVCVDNRGYAGGACLSEGRCRAGNRCEAGTCVPCSIGGLQCGCYDNGACNLGLSCSDGTCVRASLDAPQIPENPRCYTPCLRSITDAAGTFRSCGSELLMEGCLDGRSCVEGACLFEGEEPPQCADEMDCPEYQTCIDGGCWSTCTSDSECGSAAECHRKVCRQRCVPGEGVCGEGNYCASSDGQVGRCMPMAASSAQAPGPSPQSFTLSDVQLRFTSSRTSARLRIRNTSQEPGVFEVRKRSHSYLRADGSVDSRVHRIGDEDCDPAVDCPLVWLRMGAPGTTARDQQIELLIQPGEERTLVVEEAGEVAASRWEGELEVVARGGVRQRISLSYAAEPAGRWSGTFIQFGVFEAEGLDEWREGTVPSEAVPNALFQTWRNFRAGRVTRAEFLAALEALRTGSWQNAVTRSRCETLTGSPDAACFPFDNADGLGLLSTSQRAIPVPQAPAELPMALNLRERFDPALCGSSGAGRCLSGRIESSRTLHIPGDPAIGLRLEVAADSCATDGAAGCINPVERLYARSVLGGRTRPGGICRPTGRFGSMVIPWLPPEVFGLSRAQQGGGRVVQECRELGFPFSEGEDAALLNQALAGANPVLSGLPLERELVLVDGLMLQQDTLIVLVEERATSLLDRDGHASTWGVLVLERESAQVDEEEYEGNVFPDLGALGEAPVTSACEGEIGRLIPAPSPDVDPFEYARQMTRAIVDGVVREGPPTPLPSALRVHYLCEQTGQFSGGPANITPPGFPLDCVDTCTDALGDGDGACRDGGAGSVSSACDFGTDCANCGLRFEGDDGPAMEACPSGSVVRYFAVDNTRVDDADVIGHPCQFDGSCGRTLDTWVANGRFGIVPDLEWECARVRDGDGTWIDRDFCDDDRRDLRWGKRFLEPSDERRILPPLDRAVEEAFAYRTGFVATDGTRVGWAPRACGPGDGAEAFCFDADAVELLAERMACAVEIYAEYEDVLDPESGERLRAALQRHFGERVVPGSGGAPPVVSPGFERLHAELLLMLGDEALTAAAVTRFDLAGANVGVFSGQDLEPNGVELSGTAGFEMRKLYEAWQLYDLVAQRFFTQLPALTQSMRTGTRPFVDSTTALVYLPRVVLASSNRASASAEIAQRWIDLERQDVAARLIERMYVLTYLESLLLKDFVDEVLAVSAPELESVLRRELAQAQLRYGRALRQLREAWDRVDAELNAFGLPRSVIPLLPVEEDASLTGIEETLQRAFERTAIAAQLEQEAIDENREFFTGEARFRQALQQTRTEYEEELGRICGTFQADLGGDARVFPAVARYRDRSSQLQQNAEPCGAVGVGELHEAYLRGEIAYIGLEQARRALVAARERIDLEIARQEAQCNLIFEQAAFEWGQGTQKRNLQESIRLMDEIVDRTGSMLVWWSSLSTFIKCKTGLDSDNCGTAGVAIGLATAVVVGGYAIYSTLSSASDEAEIDRIRAEQAQYRREIGCERLLSEGLATIQQRATAALEAASQVRQADVELRRRTADIERLTNEAVRLQAEWEENEALLVDVQAALADPNLRVYRSSRVRSAERAFRRAAQDAWRATRLFEYVTNQSYAATGELYLSRMARLGEFNLERYLLDLEDAWRAWREETGVPARRVMVVSLRDDILRIPRMDERGAPLSQDARISALREHFRDAEFVDRLGRLRFPFNTTYSALSPRTRNHLLRWVEVEFIGGASGDGLGRVTLAQRGTGVVGSRAGARSYYPLPEQSAVVNTYFNGIRRFEEELYRSRRLQGRPVVNTRWDLLLDMVREEVNRDIDLQSLTDIRLYLVYEDETID